MTSIRGIRGGGRLRSALAANAAFSIVSGASIVAAAEPLAQLLGRPRVLLVAVGAGVLVFGFAVAFALRRLGIATGLGRAVLAADAAWVAATITVLATPGAVTGGGRWLLGLVGAAVAGLGAAEWAALRVMRTAEISGGDSREPSRAPLRP